ncbi:hypothetical protein BS78_05G188700 [Paspalum vaginatum]|nr:hypothetical protein BS78_05G188700 [Paspalum vaginatum]
MDIKFRDLEDITNNFSDDRKVGSGGYGDVYRGMYKGDEIAIKKLHQLQGLDDTEFHNEFRNLSKVKHKNIVRLVGYSYESRHKYVQHNGELVFAKAMERVLCFEYMQGGSLENHISDDSCTLEWPKCYEIIKGTCEGLDHLHNSQEKPILHMDIKPANILLDKNMTAKIADLGLSKVVAATQTYKTGSALKGSQGFMPPEYINDAYVSKKFDVYSLGVIIIKIMDGNKGRSRLSEMGNEKFIEFVCEKWRKRQQTKSGYSSDEIEMKRVKKCAEIALRCVVDDRKKRLSMKDIVQELEQVEDEIKKMLSSSDLSEDQIARQRSPGSYVIAVDPALELRFLFNPRKDISTCLQLTNMTGGFIAFDIKTNHMYRTRPSKGVMKPCSKRYISVTLIAQEAAPQNMQSNDVFVVQTASTVSKDMTSDEITEDFFRNAMAKKVVDVVKLPIVYVVLDQFEL